MRVSVFFWLLAGAGVGLALRSARAENKRRVSDVWVGGTVSGGGYWDSTGKFGGFEKTLWGGHCHLRDDDRKFRIDRTRSIEPNCADPNKRAKHTVKG